MTPRENLVASAQMVNQKLNYFRWKPDYPSLNSKRPTLVFLHGMGGTGQIWRPIAAFLESEWDCIAPDQRGHGGSRNVPPQGSEDFHAESYAKDVLELLESLSIDRFLLIGHSMGVRTALAIARQKPERVAGLIAVDIGITSNWGGGMGQPLAQFIRNLPETFPDRNQMKDYLLQHCPDPSIAQYLSAVATRPSEASGYWTFPFSHKALILTIEQAHEAPIEKWVHEITQAKVPVFFIRGMNSRVWSKEDYEEQRTRIQHPLLHFQEWENCGHGLPFEQRTRFIAMIKETAQNLSN